MQAFRDLREVGAKSSLRLETPTHLLEVEFLTNMFAWLRSHSAQLAVVFWLGLGMVLRVWSFGWYPLREDEALYAYWARLVASGTRPHVGASGHR